MADGFAADPSGDCQIHRNTGTRRGIGEIHPNISSVGRFALSDTGGGKGEIDGVFVGGDIYGGSRGSVDHTPTGIRRRAQGEGERLRLFGIAVSEDLNDQIRG